MNHNTAVAPSNRLITTLRVTDFRMHVVHSLSALVQVWRRRMRSRRELQRLNGHLLRDVGLSRRDMLREARKPFWRA